MLYKSGWKEQERGVTGHFHSALWPELIMWPHTTAGGPRGTQGDQELHQKERILEKFSFENGIKKLPPPSPFKFFHITG